MGKVVFLKLEQGGFNQGFKVTLDIAEEGRFPYVIGVIPLLSLSGYSE